MRAYYNEFDPYAAQWLRNLIASGHIAAGDVDERSIVDVQPDDLRGYTQCHFFAGIGGWSLALRLAGWPDDRPVWTGSCPCQPFSAAGKQRGSEDERHLWPAWFRLIRECAPAVCFGEQVAGSAGLAWLDHVLCDLEGAGYAAAAAVVPAGAVRAPHRRERLWFVADAQRGAAERRGHELAGSPRGAESEAQERQRVRDELGAGGDVDGVADAAEPGRSELPQRDAGTHGRPAHEPGRLRDAGGLGDAFGARLEGHGADQAESGRHAEGRSTAAAGPWDRLIWLPCADGKARPTEPGLFPLAHGIPGRVGRLRGYGNAIVPQAAAEFIAAARECLP